MDEKAVQGQLELGEACPVHGHGKRLNATIPVGEWNSHAPELTDRYRDTVYACAGTNRDGSKCSWAWSVQLGLFVPEGKNRSGLGKAALYHEKRYRPRKWQRRFKDKAAATNETDGPLPTLRGGTWRTIGTCGFRCKRRLGHQRHSTEET